MVSKSRGEWEGRLEDWKDGRRERQWSVTSGKWQVVSKGTWNWECGKDGREEDEKTGRSVVGGLRTVGDREKRKIGCWVSLRFRSLRTV